MESAGTLDYENLVEFFRVKKGRDAFLSEKRREGLADTNSWCWGHVYGKYKEAVLYCLLNHLLFSVQHKHLFLFYEAFSKVIMVQEMFVSSNMMNFKV